MKNVKLIIALFIATALIFSCKKQIIGPVQMSYEELSKYIGSENAFGVFDRSGKTEADPVARGRKVKADAVVVVWFNTLLYDGSTVSNMPADWKFAGVQNLTLMTSLCNWYAGGTSTVTSMTCAAAALVTDNERGWCTDMAENVYISN